MEGNITNLHQKRLNHAFGSSGSFSGSWENSLLAGCPLGPLFLEAGTLPAAIVKLIKRDKINGLLVQHCARLLIFRKLYFLNLAGSQVNL